MNVIRTKHSNTDAYSGMSDTDDDLLELAILLRLRNRKRRPREFGVHPIRRTKQHGHYIALLRDLKLDDREFRKYTRMSRETFTDLLGRVEAGYSLVSIIYVLGTFRLTKRSRRESINPEQRLLICLRYLATGESFRSLSFSYYLGESTVGAIVHETCKVLVEVLKPEFLVTPSTTDEWLAVAGEFWERWQLPNTLGRWLITMRRHTDLFRSHRRQTRSPEMPGQKRKSLVQLQGVLLVSSSGHRRR